MDVNTRGGTRLDLPIRSGFYDRDVPMFCATCANWYQNKCMEKHFTHDSWSTPLFALYCIWWLPLKADLGFKSPPWNSRYLCHQPWLLFKFYVTMTLPNSVTGREFLWTQQKIASVYPFHELCALYGHRAHIRGHLISSLLPATTFPLFR